MSGGVLVPPSGGGMPGVPTAVPPAAVATTRRGFTNTWLFSGIVASGMAVGLALMLLVIGATAGVSAVALGLVFAVIPLGIVVPAFLWLDRFEPEPRSRLAFAFGWGACVATVVSLVFNTTADAILTRSGAGAGAAAVVSAPVVEETTKGLVVLLILLFRRKDFDGIVDGVVLAGISAAGFAATENILYLASAAEQTGTTGLVTVFVLRGLILPFTHPLFTSFTGLGLGIAVMARRRWVRIAAPITGWVIAMGLHALWNWSASTGLVVVVFPLIGVPLFAAAVVGAVLMRRREGQVIGRYLWDYVRSGWFSPGEVWMLASISRRKAARRWARTSVGPTAVAAMRVFQNAASDLGLLRFRVVRGTAGPDAAAEEMQLLATTAAARQSFAAIPQVAVGPPPR